MSNPKPRDVDHGPESEPQASGWAELVRAQAEQVRMLTATIERQARMMELMLGSRALAAPAAEVATAIVARAEAAPAELGPTFAELWERYADTIRLKPWFHNAQSMFFRVLMHFAPSLWTPSLPGARRHRTIRRTEGPDILAANLRPFHWTEFLWALRRAEPTMAVGTRNLMLRRLKAMYNWGLDDGRLKSNPIARLKIETPRPKRETTISDEEIERVTSPIIKAYLLTLVDSGMRPGEVRSLRWDQFDETTGRTVLSWVGTKGNKTRTAWVTPRVFEAFRLLPRIPGNPYIFASPSGKNRHYSEARFWQLFRAEADKAGMRPAPGDNAVHAHDGRRSFSSRLNRKNVSITKISKLLGHSAISTTEGYISVTEEDLIEAHSQLDAAKRKPPHTSE